MAEDTLYFIQPDILERLIADRFAVKRRKNSAYALRDRRQNLSPLNVIRRAVRYEPLVFANRKADIIACAHALNNPDIRLVMVSAPNGRGKTSFVRAVVEMMGGGKEQLLWFDVSRHTGFDEIIRFLIQYLTFICQTFNLEIVIPDTEDQVVMLEKLLRQSTAFPILIVIDNMEHLVTPEQTMRSRELKEAFNFLLSFSNIKLLLAGKQLPFKDMNPSAQAVQHFELSPLTNDQSEAALLLWTTQAIPTLSALPYLSGEPERLWRFSQRYVHLAQPLAWLEQFKQALTAKTASVDALLIQNLYQQLEPAEQQLLQLMSLLRHSMSMSGFMLCIEGIQDFSLRSALLNALRQCSTEQGLLRFALQKIYLPQLVLNHLQGGTEARPEPYYQVWSAYQEVIHQTISPTLLQTYHEALEAFYQAEKTKPFHQRTYPVKSHYLTAEVQYHQSQARKIEIADSKSTTPGALLHAKNTSRLSPYYPTGREAELQILKSPLAIASQPEEPLHVKEVPAVMNTEEMPVKLSHSDLESLAQLIQRPTGIASQITIEEAALDLPDAASPPNPVKTNSTIPQEEQQLYTRIEQAICTHDRAQLSETLFELGVYRLKMGNEEGQQCLLKALEYARQAKLPALAVRINAVLGETYYQQYRHNDALNHLKEALYDLSTFPETDQQAPIHRQICTLMGDIYQYRNAYDDAISFYEQALAVVPSDLATHASLFLKLAMTWENNTANPNALGQAVQFYRKSLESSQQLGDNGACAAALYNLGNLYYETGQWTQAMEALTHCLQYDQHRDGAHQPSEEQVETWMLLSKVAEEAQLPLEARQYALSASKLLEKTPYQTLKAAAYVRLGHLTEISAEWDSAAAYYRQAKTLANPLISDEGLQWIQEKVQQMEANLK